MEERSKWWLITFAIALLAFSLMVMSCKPSQKMGNEGQITSGLPPKLILYKGISDPLGS